MRAGRVDLAPGYLSDLEGERAFIVVAIERRDVVVALAREVSELVTRMNGPGHKSTSLSIVIVALSPGLYHFKRG